MEVDDDCERASTVGPAVKERKPYTKSHVRESWSKLEHDLFLEALQLYHRDWRRIECHVSTKNVVQIRSHAQKHFQRIVKQGGGEVIPPPRPKRKMVVDGEQQQQRAQHQQHKLADSAPWVPSTDLNAAAAGLLPLAPATSLWAPSSSDMASVPTSHLTNGANHSACLEQSISPAPPFLFQQMILQQQGSDAAALAPSTRPLRKGGAAGAANEGGQRGAGGAGSASWVSSGDASTASALLASTSGAAHWALSADTAAAPAAATLSSKRSMNASLRIADKAAGVAAVSVAGGSSLGTLLQGAGRAGSTAAAGLARQQEQALLLQSQLLLPPPLPPLGSSLSSSQTAPFASSLLPPLLPSPSYTHSGLTVQPKAELSHRHTMGAAGQHDAEGPSCSSAGAGLSTQGANMYVVYSFLGSLFDPQFEHANHSEALQNMMLPDRGAAIALLGSVTQEMANCCHQLSAAGLNRLNRQAEPAGHPSPLLPAASMPSVVCPALQPAERTEMRSAGGSNEMSALDYGHNPGSSLHAPGSSSQAPSSPLQRQPSFHTADHRSRATPRRAGGLSSAGGEDEACGGGGTRYDGGTTGGGTARASRRAAAAAGLRQRGALPPTRARSPSDSPDNSSCFQQQALGGGGGSEEDTSWTDVHGDVTGGRGGGSGDLAVSGGGAAAPAAAATAKRSAAGKAAPASPPGELVGQHAVGGAALLQSASVDIAPPSSSAAACTGDDLLAAASPEGRPDAFGTDVLPQQSWQQQMSRCGQSFGDLNAFLRNDLGLYEDGEDGGSLLLLEGNLRGVGDDELDAMMLGDDVAAARLCDL